MRGARPALAESGDRRAGSGRADPDFSGSGGRGGVGEPEVGAVLVRGSLLCSGAHTAAWRRAERWEGAVQVGGYLLATPCLVGARGASGESCGPEDGSEV